MSADDLVQDLRALAVSSERVEMLYVKGQDAALLLARLDSMTTALSFEPVACPKCSQVGLAPSVCEVCGYRWYVDASDIVAVEAEAAALDVDRLARAYTAVAEESAFYGLTNREFAEAIASEYARA